MPDLLPPAALFWTFVAATLVLAVTPGPGVLYIIARTLDQGRAAGLASVAGVALGNLGNALGAAGGLAVVFAVSAFAFEVVRIAGAAYLLWLAVQALRRPRAAAAMPAAGVAERGRVFRDGCIVALLNPKTTLFFSAFLPQFIARDGASPVAQSITLGCLFVAVAAVTDGLYVLGAAALAGPLRSRRAAVSAGRYLTACAYLAMALFALFHDVRARAIGR